MSDLRQEISVSSLSPRQIDVRQFNGRAMHARMTTTLFCSPVLIKTGATAQSDC
jgi:hypothetical protein